MRRRRLRHFSIPDPFRWEKDKCDHSQLLCSSAIACMYYTGSFIHACIRTHCAVFISAVMALVFNKSQQQREREREREKERQFPVAWIYVAIKTLFFKKKWASERASKRANEVASHLVATAAFIIRALLRRKFTLCAYYHATTAVTTVCYAEYGSVISHENIPSCDVFLVCHRL